MTRFIIATLFLGSLAYADEGSRHTGVHESDSEIKGTTISNITVDFVDPGGLENDGGYVPPVKSIGRGSAVPNLNPENLTLEGKLQKGGTESKTANSKDFNFGVNSGGANGLTKSTIDNNSNVVSQLTLPNGQVKKNPMKDNGQALTKTDMAELASGKVSNINLSDGTTLGKPTAPCPG